MFFLFKMPFEKHFMTLPRGSVGIKNSSKDFKVYAQCPKFSRNRLIFSFSHQCIFILPLTHSHQITCQFRRRAEVRRKGLMAVKEDSKPVFLQTHRLRKFSLRAPTSLSKKLIHLPLHNIYIPSKCLHKLESALFQG